MGINVLVVDDSQVMRMMLIRTLRLSGIELGELYEASHGVEALRILKNNWVNLAIVDINMPVMNGEELLERMRSDVLDSATPVIVVSTEGSKTRIDRIQQLGAAFMQKPFQPEQLRDLILNTVRTA
jgi:two-component system chemotaxis response regulator CheY